MNATVTINQIHYDIMQFGNLEDSLLLNVEKQKLLKEKFNFSCSDEPDEYGRYVVHIDGDVDQFFKEAGYHLASEIEDIFKDMCI